MYDNIEDDEEEDDNVADNDVEDDDVEHNDVEDDDVEEEEEDRSHDRNPQFVQACAVEMHMDMSREPFYAEMYNVQQKCRAPGPRRRLCAILRNRSTLGHVTRAILNAFEHATSHFMRKCTRKCRAPE